MAVNYGGMSDFPGLFSAIPWVSSVTTLLMFAFQIWMIVDCIRNKNGLYWIFVILVFSVIGALVYYFVCKADSGLVEQSYSKRRQQRRRIEDLKNKIHHLDKAFHYAELGDVYREQKKWVLAQQAYVAALERDGNMVDARTHLGYVLLAQNQAEQAWTLLEPAFQKQPDFESSELLWQCARCHTALGRLPEARELYERLLARHGYPQAQLEYAELLDRLGATPASIAALKQLIADIRTAPRFHQRASRPWVRKAHRLLLTKGIKG